MFKFLEGETYINVNIKRKNKLQLRRKYQLAEHSCYSNSSDEEYFETRRRSSSI